MLAALVAATLAAAIPGPQTLAVDAAASVIRFHVSHKLHAVDGRATAVEGKALLQADGTVLAMVRIPVASLDSGDANRDANLRETLEASRHPFVVFKGVTSVAAPLEAGKAQEARLRGELDLHGVKRALEIPVEVTVAEDGSTLVRGKLTVSLEAHRIERPSLLFVKLDDECTVDVELRMRRAGT
jgi:polyisoprenoid-binding protein YceI